MDRTVQSLFSKYPVQVDVNSAIWFGFRAGGGTWNAVIELVHRVMQLVTLGVKYAFNCVIYTGMAGTLENTFHVGNCFLRILRASLFYETPEDQIRMDIM